MRGKDRRSFDTANERALQRFHSQAQQDETSRAETIYHMLLGARVRLEEVDALWTPAMARLLASAVDDLSEPAQSYLKAKLGHSVPVATLDAFSYPILTSLLTTSGPRLLRRLGAEGFLKLLDANPAVEAAPDLRGLRLEAVYRTGQWRRLRDAGSGRMTRDKDIEAAIDLLSRGKMDSLARLDLPKLRSLRFVLRWATRDSMADELFAEPVARLFLEGRSIQQATVMDIPEIAWDFATLMACIDRRGLRVSLEPVIAQASDFARSATPLPDAAAGSDALHILSFFETAPDRPILKRVDLDNHFAVISRREVEAFMDFFAPQSDDRWVNQFIVEAVSPEDYNDIVARGKRLMERLARLNGDYVIADVEITREFAAVVRGCIMSGPPRVAKQASGLLACKHPDWLEPLGNALTRAFDGVVPTRIGWWSSIDRYVGNGERSRKAKQNADGRAILSLADEAASLSGAVDAYSKLLGDRKGSKNAQDFIALSQAFGVWLAMIDRLQPSGRP